MDTKRFQLDLTEKEHAEMDRLMAFAGIRTKREFVSNALTLFRWAAYELLHGNAVGAIDSSSGRLVKQLEMPALAAFAQAGEALDRMAPSDEELLARASRLGTGIPAEKVLQEMKQNLREEPDEPKRRLRAGSAEHVG